MTAALVPGALVALLAGGTAGALWWLVLPRLAEPDRSKGKRAYADLATARAALAVAGLAALSVAAVWARLPRAEQPMWVVLSIFGVFLATVDGLTTWIPASVTRCSWLVMAAAALLTVLLGASWADVERATAGGLAAGGLYGLVWLLTRGGFGFGDVRFVPLIGATAASNSWTMWFTAMLMGSLLAIAHGLWRLVRRIGGTQPWAPTLLIGAYGALLIVS